MGEDPAPAAEDAASVDGPATLPPVDSNRYLRRLQRDTVREDILQALKAAILTGELEDGRLYSMGELADQFGASRTPVREALLELEKRGLVEIIRSVGFRVTAPTVHDLGHTLEIRELLEIPTIRRIAGRVSKEAVARAREILVLLRQAEQSDDIPAFHELDRQFHVHLVLQSGNERLARIVEEMREFQWIPGLRNRGLAGQLHARNREHRMLLDAIEAGDPKRAESVLRDHLAFSRKAWGVRADVR